MSYQGYGNRQSRIPVVLLLNSNIYFAYIIYSSPPLSWDGANMRDPLCNYSGGCISCHNYTGNYATIQRDHIIYDVPKEEGGGG